MKFWYWSQPAVAIILLGVTLYTIVNLFVVPSLGPTSIQFAVNGLFIFPGMLISLGLGQVLLSRRHPRVVTVAERVLLSIQFALLAVVIATSIPEEALYVGLIVWPLLMLFAVITTVVIGVRRATPEPVAISENPAS